MLTLKLMSSFVNNVWWLSCQRGVIQCIICVYIWFLGYCKEHEKNVDVIGKVSHVLSKRHCRKYCFNVSYFYDTTPKQVLQYQTRPLFRMIGMMYAEFNKTVYAGIQIILMSSLTAICHINLCQNTINRI